MTDWASLERRFTDRLRLGRRPVALAFLDREPAGVPKFKGQEPSGCSFWRLAANGRVFYTVPSDHYNCAVGSYTHNIALPPERARELEDTLGLMFEVGYIQPEEVPGIPRLPRSPAVIVYAPLGGIPLDPDVVLFVCEPGAAMLLNEAAMRAGAGSALPLLGRPTCMALPAALAKGTTITLGCIGNRVYTDLGENELYAVLPAARLSEVADALDVIGVANQKLAEYASGRRRELSVESPG